MSRDKFESYENQREVGDQEMAQQVTEIFPIWRNN